MEIGRLSGVNAPDEGHTDGKLSAGTWRNEIKIIKEINKHEQKSIYGTVSAYDLAFPCT